MLVPTLVPNPALPIDIRRKASIVNMAELHDVEPCQVRVSGCIADLKIRVSKINPGDCVRPWPPNSSKDQYRSARRFGRSVSASDLPCFRSDTVRAIIAGIAIIA